MIKELTQFIQKEIPSQIKGKTIEPKKGLHILIEFDGSGKAQILGRERYLGKNHVQTSEFLKDCAKRQEASWMINTNKCFDLPSRGIHTVSPYSIAFKIKLSKEDEVNKEKSKKLKQDKPDKEYKEKIVKGTLERLDKYFEKSFNKKYSLNETEKQQIIQLKNFLKINFSSFLLNISEYNDIDWDDYILIYLNEPLDKYLDFQNIYMAESLFNTSSYNIESNGNILGSSNFYNGFNSKKPFLEHQTAAFDITGRISTSEAKALDEFKAMATRKLFPNPTPIFIEKNELTKEAIRIFHREEDNNRSHRVIIEELMKREEDLGNYYLIYFSGGDIKDFDFVPKFKYYLDSEKDQHGQIRTWVIHNITEIPEKRGMPMPKIHLKNVFDFERIIVRHLFNNYLVKIDEKKGETTFRYFDELDSKYYRRLAFFTLMLKYRKPIYDFIYKSMRSGIGSHQFQDICMTGIMDDLKEDKAYALKIKLNIFFSLYNNFRNTQNKSIMPSKIEEHKAHLKEVLENEETHFSSDEAYAYGAGQLIYYLLSKSESGDRTHAHLEPFLQKTNYTHFNEAISNLILKYKHAIGFDLKRFNMLSGEILGYEAEKSLAELRPLILAGYFTPNILYKSTKTNS